MVDLESNQQSLRDDAILGEALVRAGVLGTGHNPQPVEQYLSRYKVEPASKRPYQTSARGLREFFRYAGCLVEEQDLDDAWLTPLGKLLAIQSERVFNEADVASWRVAVASIRIGSATRGYSHPYRVLLRLIEARPGLPAKLSPLAFEADDDSDSELERIAALSDLKEESRIRDAIGGETEANWNNAKKVLPAIGEQLGDISRDGGVLLRRSAESEPSPRNSMPMPNLLERPEVPDSVASVRDRRDMQSPRRGRRVSVTQIARAGQYSRDSQYFLRTLRHDPVAAAEAMTTRAVRLTRHNEIVRRLAKLLQLKGAALWEDPFDCVAKLNGRAVLFEVKTLDGSLADEIERVRDAMGQVRYYRFFNMPVECVSPTMVAVFESKPTDQHVEWLSDAGVETAWFSDTTLVFAREGFSLDELFA